MLLKVSLDGRTCRTKKLKEALNEIEPKKGILIHKSCSGCHITVKDAHIIKCAYCECRFHQECIVNPVSTEVAKQLMENPSLWWTCTGCLIDAVHQQNGKEDNDVYCVDNSATQLGDVTALLSSIVKKSITESLTDLKSDLFIEMKSMITSSMSNTDANTSTVNIADNVVRTDSYQSDIMDLDCSSSRKRKRYSVADGSKSVTNFNSKESDENTQIMKDNWVTSSIPSYSRVTQTASRKHSNSTYLAQNSIINKDNHKSYISKPEIVSEVLVLQGKTHSNDQVLSNEQWQILRRSIAKELSNVKIMFTKKSSQTNKITLGFPTLKDKELAKQILLSMPDLQNYDIRDPIKMLPKMTISYVPLDIDVEDTQNISDQKEIFKNSILSKNEGIQNLVQSGKVLDIVFVKKHINNYTIVIKVSPEIRTFITNQLSSKLFIFSCRCKVSDRYHCKQCYQCMRFGHYAQECPDKQDNKQTCKYCAKDHSFTKCLVRDDVTNHKCANCFRSKNSNFLMNAHTHNAMSPSCPIFISVCKRLHRNTQYDKSKN